MVRKVITKMIFADRIVLFANNCELTRGDCDLLSMTMNRNNETVPTHNSTIINGELRKLSVCEYESTNRNEETVTARVIVPFISKVLLLSLFDLLSGYLATASSSLTALSLVSDEGGF